MNITVKDVPKQLHKRLKSAAEESGRSLNKLILVTLDNAMNPRKVDRAEVLHRIRTRRNGMAATLNDSTLAEAINHGRE